MRKNNHHGIICLILLATVLFVSACQPKINIFPDQSEPLEEFTLQGDGADKILLVQVNGTISTSSRSGLLVERPSLVQEVTSRLRKAAEDDAVKAVVLAIDTPGGSVTASDILYEEIMRHKQKTGNKTVALLMGLAASGGYYTAVAADSIIAHPTTITGSIGTIYIRPDVAALMNKIGVKAEVTKSGKYKDISSWFRDSTEEERAIMQQMINQLNARFLELVRTRRQLDDTRMHTIAQARVFTAAQARELGLVDGIGYAQEAFDQAKKLAGLEKDAKVVTYRRREFADDTPYNNMEAALGGKSPLMEGAGRLLQALEPGFHYLWLPGAGF